MSEIRILPEILSNKIAAGEVIERPAAAVKELIENSLDAGSTKITIDIENGGRALIRVSDNGCGMDKDDAMLSVERYATSKLKQDSDLFSISTLGFRGEALPSIASVSRFKIVTRPEGNDSGILVSIEGGRVIKVEETGAPKGTMVTVEQLFYNTPARRKFLKTINTEMGHIAETIASIALGWPKVMFRLSHNGKLLKSWPGTQSTYERAVDVLGRDLKNKLCRIHHKDSEIEINGFVSTPDITRSTSQKIYLYVNGRFIKDRGLIHALFDGFGSRLMKGRYPVAIIFIDLPFDKIDVNVHPTKHEIRFSEKKNVFDPLKQCVESALKKAEQTRLVISPEPSASGLNVAENNGKLIEKTGFVLEENLSVNPKEEFKPELASAKKTSFGDVFDPNPSIAEKINQFQSGEQIKSKQVPAQEELWEKHFFSDLTIIGQFRNSYILCESTDGLIIIDQHAAHERIVYESLKKRGGRKSSQALLMPETIELGYKEAAALETILPSLNEIGLEVEPFGGNTFIIKAVPTMIADNKLPSLLTEIAEKMVTIEKTDAIEKALDECLILMACHGAVRAKAKLADEQIKHLLKQMDATENSSCCPHGRPTWVRWNVKFLEKSFKRIV